MQCTISPAVGRDWLRSLITFYNTPRASLMCGLAAASTWQITGWSKSRCSNRAEEDHTKPHDEDECDFSARDFAESFEGGFEMFNNFLGVSLPFSSRWLAQA